jgi:hypothetical protein
MFAHFLNLTGFGFQIITAKQGCPIYRARYSNTTEPFRHLSEMSYPQKSHVKYFSRLNRPCQNIFYASESESACLTEMLPFWFAEFNTNDKITVTLGKWIVREDIRLLIIPDTQNKNEKIKKFFTSCIQVKLNSGIIFQINSRLQQKMIKVFMSSQLLLEMRFG